MISNPRIVIVGAGAVGSLVGGMLADKGHDVTLIGRGRQVEAIRQNGLRITGALGQLTVKVSAETQLNFQPDILFLAVKANDVESACRSIQHLAENIPVVVMQNGIAADETAAAFFGSQWVVGCVVLFNARYQAPGHVHCGFSGHVILPAPESENSRSVASIYSILHDLFPCQQVKDFKAARWTKLIINAMGNGVEAISGLSLGHCSTHPILGKVAVLLVREGLRILKGKGISLLTLPGFPMKQLKRLVQMPLGIASRLLRKKWQRERVQDVISSTLQSLQRGKATEIDYLNGEIVRSGNHMGIPTPVNAHVVSWVHRVESSGTFISLNEMDQTLFRN